MPVLYLLVAELPLLSQPARVIRDRGVTLIWTDPSTLRTEMASWSRLHLHPEERQAFRAAYGVDADLLTPIPAQCLAGTMGDGDIPDPLRVPRSFTRGLASASGQ